MLKQEKKNQKIRNGSDAVENKIPFILNGLCPLNYVCKLVVFTN